MTARAIAAAIAVTAVLAGCEASRNNVAGGAAKVDRGRVVSVTDGDTLRVRIGGRSERVRLLGIDTAETRRPGTAVGRRRRCAATRRLGELLRLRRAPGAPGAALQAFGGGRPGRGPWRVGQLWR